MKDAIAQELARHPDVRLAYLFGSRANGRATPGSDWDIAVLLDRGGAPGRPLELAGLIEERLGMRCDVVSLNESPIEFSSRVILEGQRLSVQREDPVEYEANILARASVQRPLLERQRREIVEGNAGGRAVERYRKALGTTR